MALGGSYEVECGITACTFGSRFCQGYTTFLSGTRPCLLEVLRSASTPGRQPSKGLPQGSAFTASWIRRIFSCFCISSLFVRLTGETRLPLLAKISTFHLWGC
jgi:hypothetical protein